MKFFHCEVELEDDKDPLPSNHVSVWIVKDLNEEDARMKIFRHFRENNLINKNRRIISIAFTEIRLEQGEDIEEHLEERGGSRFSVLF